MAKLKVIAACASGMTDAKLARLDMTDGEIDAVRAAMRATGGPFRSICLSGHRKFPLGCPDRQKQDRSLEIMQKAIALVAKLRNAIRWPCYTIKARTIFSAQPQGRSAAAGLYLWERWL
ncbi:hypothetical protein FZ041_06180 [Selenomonas caprae]|uniref:Uncharacterized protein n=1 Tax=Selenomonas caprae TaxID=2606905 RepID=A0A5D6WQC3_9FIRM|nr:hypothetical protein [Selenomonas caprae]TYZ29128.1 hypothetical protein FZ041_06180 [Selenomonas caprae]